MNWVASLAGSPFDGGTDWWAGPGRGIMRGVNRNREATNSDGRGELQRRGANLGGHVVVPGRSGNEREREKGRETDGRRDDGQRDRDDEPGGAAAAGGV